MHGTDFNIALSDLSKIEGHAGLDVTVKRGRVVGVRLRVSETKRFFTTAAVGKPSLAVHQVVSRICGTCSIAHLACCINCVENAFGVTPSQQTVNLRDLLLYGLNIRDHAMHLYLFCLPDLFGKDSLLDFADAGYEHDLVHKAFAVKSAGNSLSTLVGGRAVHAPFPRVGWFSSVPPVHSSKQVVRELKQVREDAVEFAGLFFERSPCFNTDTRYVALRNPRFSFLGGDLITSDGLCISHNHFREHLQKYVMPYSQAPGFAFKGRPYMVGALARLNMNADTLHKRTRKDLKKFLKVFPSRNVFHNNLAQAIEIVHCIDSAVDLLEGADFKLEQPPPIALKEAEGVGVIEAPRGTLYYNLRTDAAGKVAYADLVIPTSQNQVKIEKDIGVLVQQKLDEGFKKEALPLEIETLIRAYDPCMSCATHFLKVNWK